MDISVLEPPMRVWSSDWLNMVSQEVEMISLRPRRKAEVWRCGWICRR